jgi:hypothetical protein
MVLIASKSLSFGVVVSVGAELLEMGEVSTVFKDIAVDFLCDSLVSRYSEDPRSVVGSSLLRVRDGYSLMAYPSERFVGLDVPALVYSSGLASSLAGSVVDQVSHSFFSRDIKVGGCC